MSQRRSETAVAAKSIVLFSDGTGNSSAALFKTNVWRMYEAADLGPAQEGKQRQIAFYDDGIGSSGFRALQMLKGIFGIGLRRNVLNLYQDACRNYDPNSVPGPESDIDRSGDQIYGFGFSRGAFTMRLVIGMIAGQGPVPYVDDADLAWKTGQVYADFRRGCRRGVSRFVRNLLRRPEPPVVPRIRTQAGRTYDPVENFHPVIRFIGVWDTVAAYGGPITEITRAIDTWVYPLSMPNYELSENVLCARHALAIDDERDSFWPLLWDEVHEQELVDKKKVAADRLMQVWFTGMHADVGGGYPDESLSYVSLLWMMGEAGKCGLRTVDEITDRYVALVNSFGPIHDSRAGMAGYYRYQPRRLAAWLDPPTPQTIGYRDPTIRRSDGTLKGLLRKVVVHESVIDRIASGTDGYAPIVLPAQFDVVPPGNRLSETAAQPTSGGDEIAAERAPQAADMTLKADGPSNAQDAAAAKRAVAAAMERVWNLVWYRRTVYFLTVLATIALFAWPWIPGDEIQYWVEAQNVSALQLLFQTLGGLIGGAIKWVGTFLPAFAGRWIAAWASSPWSFVINVGAIALLRGLGGWLARKISDEARSIWHGVLPRIPPASAPAEAAGVRSHMPGWLQKLRNSKGYQWWLQFIKWAILPNAAGLAIVGLAGWLVVAASVQGLMPVRETTTTFCGSAAPTSTTKSGAAGGADVVSQFDTRVLCNTTGMTVTRGTQYTVMFDVTGPWMDDDTAATPVGLTASRLPRFAGYFGAPLRRVITGRYLQPVALIRTTRRNGDSTVRLLRLKLAPAADIANRYEGTFTAPANGELVLFANDAVGLFDPDAYYGNNKGTATVTIRPENRAKPSPPGGAKH